MSAASFVATLVAPSGEFLSKTDIDLFTSRVVQVGGTVARQALVDDGRAADVFFSEVIPEAEGLPFDILIQPVANRCKKILIADMESTIIGQEMLDELAAEIGIGDRVADITRRAMNGELDFTAALTERANLLENQPESLIQKVASRMEPNPGADALIKAMKQAGSACWLVSGGFTCFASIIAERLGFDRFFANELGIENGVLTGDIARPVLDREAKKKILHQACAAYGCSLADALAVGDGANDVPMLQACAEGGGLGVAYHAKPRVRELIHNRIDRGDFSALIYAQGLFA
ncbi:MAG: phosphoserine phosphatase SerB [Alphaproteobacteria bacterium]|nr:phosphoserine phosphatase SerB [Alphaproteobacteria bacterium]